MHGRRITPLPAVPRLSKGARRQNAARVCHQRRQRAGDRVRLQPGDTRGGDAGPRCSLPTRRDGSRSALRGCRSCCGPNH